MSVVGDGWLFAELDATLRDGVVDGTRRELLRLDGGDGHRWDDEDTAWTALVAWLTALEQIAWLDVVELPAPAAVAALAPRALVELDIDEHDERLTAERIAAVDVVAVTPSLRDAHTANLRHAREHGRPASQRDARMLWGTAGMLARSACSCRPMAPHPARIHMLDATRAESADTLLTLTLPGAAVDAILAAPDAESMLRAADELRDEVADARERLQAWLDASQDEADADALADSLGAPDGAPHCRLSARRVTWQRRPFESEDVEPGRMVERRAWVLAFAHQASSPGRDAVERWLELFELARTSLGARLRERYARMAEIRSWRYADTPRVAQKHNRR